MKKFLLSFVLFISAIALSAQDFEVPKEYTLKEASDYEQYEDDIIKCVDWLIATPLNIQTAKRKDAYAFLVVWVSGSPKVSIVLSEKIVTFSKNGDLLAMFLGGWTKYSIETEKYDDIFNNNLAGVMCAITFYEKNKEFTGKIKAADKYLKLKAQGKLEEYIKDNI
jgi:hypothetical protein